MGFCLVPQCVLVFIYTSYYLPFIFRNLPEYSPEKQLETFPHVIHDVNFFFLFQIGGMEGEREGEKH